MCCLVYQRSYRGLNRTDAAFGTDWLFHWSWLIRGPNANLVRSHVKQTRTKILNQYEQLQGPNKNVLQSRQSVYCQTILYYHFRSTFCNVDFYGTLLIKSLVHFRKPILSKKPQGSFYPTLCSKIRHEYTYILQQFNIIWQVIELREFDLEL